MAQLRKAWAEHLLLLFPGIHLDPAQQVTLARHFGSRLAATTELGEDYYKDWRASNIPDSGPYKVRSEMEDGECRNRAGVSLLSSRIKR